MDGVSLIAQYGGIDGFLSTRASIMLDVVVLAMVLVLPILGWSIWLVRRKRNYQLHKRVQLLLAAVLLVAVVAFEVDMRFISGWHDRAQPSPYWPRGVWTSLIVHLVFSISTAFVWLYVVIGALRNIPKPPGPSAYSGWHKLWGWIAAVDMALTAITGWIFYWVAFVA
jgi:putative membrane protein